ncbi:unnamed protein product [Alternaria alternata]
MTLRPASGSAEMSDEEMPPEQDEISNDEEIRTTQSSEGPVSKVAVRQGLNIHPGVSKCTELTGDTSVIDAVDANESKIEDITKKLDDLARLVQRLEVRPDQSLSQRSTINANLHTTNKSSRPPQTSTPDHEGIDISLLLNVIQVADLLETALDHEDTGDQSSTVADIRLSRQTLQDARWDEDSRGTIGELMPVEFAQHATRATDYLLLVAIYRVAFSKPSTKVSSECIAAARTSLREHTQCIALLVSYNNDPALFELWVNGGLILFAFVPFNIIFCSVIETANLADLESLETYVDALASLAKKPEYTSCAKQLEIFRALHKLALVHSEIRAQMQLSSCPSGPLSSSAKDAGLEGLPDTLGGLPSWHDRDGMWNGSINTTNEPSVLASQPWADFGGMDLDPLGTQLGYWIQESSQDFDNFGET